MVGNGPSSTIFQLSIRFFPHHTREPNVKNHLGFSTRLDLTEIRYDEVISDSRTVVSKLVFDKEKPFEVTYQTRQKVFYLGNEKNDESLSKGRLDYRATLSRIYLRCEDSKTTGLARANGVGTRNM